MALKLPKRTKKAPKKNKKNRKRMNPKLRKFLTVVLSLIFFAVLCVCIVGGYYLKFAVSYVDGEPQMNIEEYKENQAQTTIIYAYNDSEEFEEMPIWPAEGSVKMIDGMAVIKFSDYPPRYY